MPACIGRDDFRSGPAIAYPARYEIFANAMVRQPPTVGNMDQLAALKADLIYHLLVVLEVGGVSLDAVKAELAGRTGQTGLEEKASRGKKQP